MEIVLGGDLAGLTIANQLNKPILIEKEYKVGGLSSSKRIAHYIVDRGLNVLNGINDDFKPLGRLIKRKKRVKICMSKNNLIDFNFPRKENSEKNKPKIENYLEYLNATFEDEGLNNFYIPYSEKFWGINLKELGIDWIEENNNCSSDYFWYPKKGGIGYISFRLFQELKRKNSMLLLNNGIAHIDFINNIIKTSSGFTMDYTKCYNTLPFPELIGEFPDNVKEAITSLKYTRNHYISYVIDKAYISSEYQDLHWVYFPQKEVPFFRVNFPSNIGSNNCLPQKTLIQCEINGNPVDCIKSLLDMGVVTKKPKKIFIDYAKYSNCIPTINRKKNFEIVNKFLNEHNIFNYGKFGTCENIQMYESLNIKI